MATNATQIQQKDISDWPGSPLSTVHPLAATAHPISVEQHPDGSAYVIRLELPGIDPVRDLQVTVQARIVTVRIGMGAEHQDVARRVDVRVL
jgi:HSP20 family protein